VTGNGANFNFGTSDFTFTAWARANDVVTIDRKLFHFNISGGKEAVWQVRQDGQALKINTYNGSWLGVGTLNDVFDDTDWHHVALVREGTAVTIYVDGAPQTTTGSIHSTLSTSVNDTFYVGSRTNEDYWNGAIDDVRIWNHARTGPEILSDMGMVGSTTSVSGTMRGPDQRS